MKLLTLAVIIPVKNEEDYITACLDAIANQTEQPDEVIVVDNNCTDRTIELALRFPFVTVVQEKRPGIVFARNCGFNAARADIIGRIDADTVLDPDWVAKAKRYFKDNQEVSALTGNCYFYDFPARQATQFVHHLTYYSAQKALIGTDVLWGSNMAVRRSAWRTVRPYCNNSSEVHEDIDLTLRMKRLGLRVKRLPSLTAGVSMRRGNLTPDSVIRYLTPWPKTYWQGRYYGAAFGVSVLYAWVLFWIIPILYVRSFIMSLSEELKL